ncbi:MAG: hypothetical protein H7239_05010 [Flavobacterium sp.]|nr:hypothetical protein [Flavobacterium sp.]
MKKNIVLFVLFILPIVAYLFFASGVNSFAKLPTLTKSLPEISNFKTDDGKITSLKNKITILGFGGTILHKGNFFNLYEKIYAKNKDFKDFQIVFICPEGTQSKVEDLKNDLKKLGDLKGWHFVFGEPSAINEFHNKMKLVSTLDANSGTETVFIIDKKLNLRGRKGKSVKGDVEYREGYNTKMVSELHNEMTDDVKVILAEYRLALKRNHNATRQI